MEAWTKTWEEAEDCAEIMRQRVIEEKRQEKDGDGVFADARTWRAWMGKTLRYCLRFNWGKSLMYSYWDIIELEMKTGASVDFHDEVAGSEGDGVERMEAEVVG